METKRMLSSDNKTALLSTLERRFGENGSRHAGLQWSEVSRAVANRRRQQRS
ncbi:hypothetical protein GGR26_003522 [Lewinella marina]|uniref:DUF4256 domain-containing protein n=1 Tax=Neolewinella marina TaxID=438751 RepID=UPI00117B31AB|nr:DUF4256 domain-containing protein [Neolewinella marina]NJB87736.1 hypothetical protein [Neolewinella marina]